MRKKKIRKSRTMIVCYRREHALDASAHLDINAHCFFEVNGLVSLSPFSVFFGGVRDGCCGVDFRGAGAPITFSVQAVLLALHIFVFLLRRNVKRWRDLIPIPIPTPANLLLHPLVNSVPYPPFLLSMRLD